MQFESSPSTTLQNTYEEEDDITDFEIGEPDCSQASLLAEYPVVDTLNLDKPSINFNNEIVSDHALDNNIVPNLNDEKVVLVFKYQGVQVLNNLKKFDIYRNAKTKLHFLRYLKPYLLLKYI